MKNLDKFVNAQGKVWVNVASSIYVLENFINIDNHVFLHLLPLYPIIEKFLPSKYKQSFETYWSASKKATLLKQDCRKPLKFPDNSIDHLLCSHFLEHVFPDEMKRIVSDYYRVIKPGGTMHIIVPDFELLVKEYLQRLANCENEASDLFIKESLLSKESRGTWLYRFLELYGGFGLQHRWMYDRKSLSEKIEAAGFSILPGNTTPSLNYRLNDGSVHLCATKP